MLLLQETGCQARLLPIPQGDPRAGGGHKAPHVWLLRGQSPTAAQTSSICLRWEKDGNCLSVDSDLVICSSLTLLAAQDPDSLFPHFTKHWIDSLNDACSSSQSFISVLATFDRCSLMLVYSLFVALSLSKQPQGLNTEDSLCSSLVK